MTTATRNRPLWHRLRDALADIERGLYPNRAFDFHRIPKHWRDDSRIHHRIAQSEAACQRDAILAIADAGSKGYSEHGLAAGANGGTLTGRARVRTWQSKDWRAPAWLLERRFPQEYGAQPTVVVDTSPVLAMAQLLAQLRASSPELLIVYQS